MDDVTLPLEVKRICPRQEGVAQFIFDNQVIDILSSPTALLNDVCLNGGAAVLYRYISSQYPPCTQRCALLSTFDLVRIRGNLSDAILWRNIRHTLYWRKSVWILPVHRPRPAGHWVLAIIYTDAQEIHLFDSLASRQAWLGDVEVSLIRVELFH
jgi:Ulp1 family protease